MLQKFDKIFFLFAILILITTVIFLPKENLRFSDTEIVFLQWWENELMNDALKDLIAEFEADNAGIKIILETKTKKEIKDELFAFMQEQNKPEQKEKEQKDGEKNKAPDIIALDTLWFEDLQGIDFFEDLNTYSLAITTHKTAHIFSFVSPLYYNIPMLINLGSDRPVKTQSDFLSICRKLKEKNYFGYSIDNDYFEEIFPWIAMSGLDLPAEDDPHEFDFKSKKFIATLELFDTLQEESLMNITMQDTDKKILDFCEGKTAMMRAPYYAADKIKLKNPKINFNVTTIPYYGDYPPKTVFVFEDRNVAMPSLSLHKDDAAKFIVFLMNNKQKLLARTEDRLDSIAGADKDKGEMAVYEKLKSIEGGGTVAVQDVFKRGDAVKTIFNEEVGIMLKTKRTAKETALIIQERYYEED